MVEEKDLLDRAAQGDERAWDEIVHRYHRLVTSTARRILRNDNDVKDAVQDSFINAFKQIKQYRREAKFSTWLYRISLRSAISHVRKTHPERYVQSDSQPESGLIAQDSAIADYSREKAKQHQEAWYEDCREIAREVLRGFDSTRAAIIKLRLEDSECDEIARLLDVSVEMVYDANKEFSRRCLNLKEKLRRSKQRTPAGQSP